MLHLLVAAAAAADADPSASLEELRLRLAEESSIGWTAILVTALCSIAVILVTVPFLLWCMVAQRPQLAPVEDLSAPQARAAKRMPPAERRKRRQRPIKWTLDDITSKPQDLPVEMRGQADLKDSVAKFAEREEDDTSGDEQEPEEEEKLTPEEIIRRHQEMPREPHVGIFVGVDDPRHNSVAGGAFRNPRCSVDARDLSDAFARLDYRCFCLHDHSKQADRAMLPTRTGLAGVIRSLKEGRYDDETRKKPNTNPWMTCLVYLATRVRIATSHEGEGLEFMLRQDHEPGDGVWVAMTELLNKLSDIPHRQTIVILDVVHTGKDDVQYDPKSGEDIPAAGERHSVAELLFRTGKFCGLVDNLRCAVVGCTRPETMPRTVSADGVERKLRHGPFVHFIDTGLKDVDKKDPSREIWEQMAERSGGMFAGGLGTMPAAIPITVGDVGMCPFHCGDMTVDSVQRFLAKKMRALTQDVCCDPAYATGSVNMAFAHQRASRPRDAPPTPVYSHECRREQLVDGITAALAPGKIVALHGEAGSGKTSAALAVLWSQAVLAQYTEGLYYFSLRRPLADLEGEGFCPVVDMQTSLALSSCGQEGMLPGEVDGATYLKHSFSHLRTAIVIDDVACLADVDRLRRALCLSRDDGKQTRTAVIVVTDIEAVAEGCDSRIDVPHLAAPEAEQLLAAGSGYLSKDDMPPAAAEMLKRCGHSALLVGLLATALRGSEPEVWAEALSEFGDRDPIDAVLNLLPSDMLDCLVALARLPAHRPVSTHALPLLWSRAGFGDPNLSNAMLARVLEAGAGMLLCEDGEPRRKREAGDNSLLIHPLVAERLRKVAEAEDVDKIIVATYVDLAAVARGTVLTLDEESSLNWATQPWDGFFHLHAVGHLHARAPALVEAMYRNPRWVTAQIDAVGVDKCASDMARYGSKDCAVTAALLQVLQSSKVTLRRSQWELLSQLYSRLSAHKSPAVQHFCADLVQGSRAALPGERGFLWLKPLHGADVFATERRVASAALSVCFWKDCLVSGHQDGKVQVWRIADGSLVKTLEGHTGAVHLIVVTKDDRLATGSRDEDRDKRIRLWNVETGSCEVVGVEQRPTSADRPTHGFGIKATRGRSGFDTGERDSGDYAYGFPSSEKMVEDSLLIETEELSERNGGHTFVGWDAHSVLASLTMGVKINMQATAEFRDRLLCATADDLGRALLFEVQTTDTRDAENSTD